MITQKIKNFLYNICHYGYGIFIITLFCLIFLVVLSPIYILRLISYVSSKLLRSDLSQIFSWLDITLFEDLHKNHSCTTVTICTLNGDLSAKRVRKLFCQNILKFPEFPKLTQIPTKWLGFLFWREDPYFKIENHVSEVFVNDNHLTPSYFRSLDGIMEEFGTRPYMEGRCPWEVVLVKNYKTAPVQTLLIMRNHHSMQDATAGLHLLVHGLGRKLKVIVPPSSTLSKASKSGGWLSSILNFIGGAVELQQQFVHNYGLKRIFSNRHTKEGRLIYRSCRVLKEDVKRLSRKYNARLSSVMVALFEENISRVLRKEISWCSGNIVVHTPYLMPLPNRPGTQCNHMKFGSVQVHLDNTTDVVSRMKKFNEAFISLNDNPTTNVIKYFVPSVGNLFPDLSIFLRNRCTYGVFAITNFAAESEGFSIGGCECVDLNAVVGAADSVTESALVIYGYKNYIHVTLNSNDGFLSEKEVEQVVRGIYEDLHKLLREDTE